jgi:hypothetical protein
VRSWTECSLTAEKIGKVCLLPRPAPQARNLDARIIITAGHLGWGDLIFRWRNPPQPPPAQVPGSHEGAAVTLLIPDDYNS